MKNIAMISEELSKAVDLENQRLLKYYACPTESEEILARTIKLGEEFGELCDEILASRGDQRKEKLINYNPENLPKEFADVIIAALLLAKAAGVDIEDALTKKTETINYKNDQFEFPSNPRTN